MSAPPTGDFDRGELLYATEESFQPGCEDDGVFAIASLEGSYEGQAWRSTPADPFRLETVGTWSVADKEGSSASGDCSAHNFQIQDDLVVYSWYAQGTRFLDVSDLTDPIQVAYFRPDDGRSWASTSIGATCTLRITAGAWTSSVWRLRAKPRPSPTRRCWHRRCQPE